MIVYVTNNKEPWTLNLKQIEIQPIVSSTNLNALGLFVNWLKIKHFAQFIICDTIIATGCLYSSM